MRLKNIIGTISICIAIILTIAFTNTNRTLAEDAFDIKTYHYDNNPTVNLDDFGEFTPVQTVGELASKILSFFMKVLGGIAILGVIAGGIMIMGGGFSEDTMENGKTLLLYSVIGVGVAMLAVVIVTLAQSFLYSFGK